MAGRSLGDDKQILTGNSWETNTRSRSHSPVSHLMGSRIHDEGKQVGAVERGDALKCTLSPSYTYTHRSSHTLEFLQLYASVPSVWQSNEKLVWRSYHRGLCCQGFTWFETQSLTGNACATSYVNAWIILSSTTGRVLSSVAVCKSLWLWRVLTPTWLRAELASWMIQVHNSCKYNLAKHILSSEKKNGKLVKKNSGRWWWSAGILSWTLLLEQTKS